jgi:U3 small nucleolar RNA-associated protein 20
VAVVVADAPVGTPEEHAIHLACTKNIIPKMYSHLTVKTEEDDGKKATIQMRPIVALALVNLMVKLPKVTLESLLPQLLTKVAGVLRDRLQSARDQARTTLAEISTILGPYYVPFIIREIKGGLTRGYQLHVLGYSVHHVLDGLGDTIVAGSLDDAIEDCVGIFIDDIFGVQAEERDEYQIAAKLKEARSVMSFDSFRILAKSITGPKLPELFSYIKDVMSTSESLKKADKLDEIFRNVCIGVNSNLGMSPVDKMEVAFTLIRENFQMSKEGKKTKIDRSHREESIKMYKSKPAREGEGIDSSQNFNTNAHLLVEVGLLLLLTLLKQGHVSRGNEDHLAQLDSLVETMTECLGSKYNKTAILALRTLSLTLKFGEMLPTLQKQAGRINQRVFKLMRVGGQSESAMDLNQACFRLIAGLVRDCPWHAVTENEVKVLLSFIEVDLETSGKQNTVFVVLKAIIARKLIAPELYDVMDRVSELMIRTHAPGIRDHCRQVVLPFLLEYPLGKKRLEKSINFLVSNLDFEHETGRESALQMLESVTIKFPEEVVEEYADLFFVSLIKQLVNGTSPLLRETASNCLQLLIGSVGTTKQDLLHSMAVCWLDQGSPELCRAAVQVVAAFVDALHKGYNRHVASTLPKLKALLEANTPKVEVKDPMAFSVDDDDKVDNWEVVYLCLGTVQKIFVAFPKEFERSVVLASSTVAADTEATPAADSGGGAASKKRRKSKGSSHVAAPAIQLTMDQNDTNSKFWAMVEQWLLFDHHWVRLAAARLFGTYFAARTPQLFVKPAGNEYLAMPTAIFRVGKQMCAMLESERLTDDLSDVLVKNVHFVIRVLVGLHAAFVPPAEGEDVDEKDVRNPSGLVWTVKQLAYWARTETNQSPDTAFRREVVYKVFAAMVQFMKSAEDVLPHLNTVVESLYRTEESEASPPEIKDIGSQVQKLIQKKVGNGPYFTAFNKARDKVAKARAQRKQQQMQMAMVDPQQAAERKIKDNLKKKVNRKRKIQKQREESGRSFKRIDSAGNGPSYDNM